MICWAIFHPFMYGSRLVMRFWCLIGVAQLSSELVFAYQLFTIARILEWSWLLDTRGCSFKRGTRIVSQSSRALKKKLNQNCIEWWMCFINICRDAFTSLRATKTARSIQCCELSRIKCLLGTRVMAQSFMTIKVLNEDERRDDHVLCKATSKNVELFNVSRNYHIDNNNMTRRRHKIAFETETDILVVQFTSECASLTLSSSWVIRLSSS